MLKYAAQNGAQVRWNTEYQHFVETEGGLLSTCRDLQTGRDFQILSKYLCGAKGGRSKIISEIGATLAGPRDETEICYSITFSADLTRTVSKCPAFMQFIIRPDQPLDANCMVASLRVIRPFISSSLSPSPLPRHRH